MKIKHLFGFTNQAKAGKSPAADAAIPPRPVCWHSHGLTDVGHRRKINEDAFLDRPDIGLWMVADGMGGHQAGDVASNALVQSLAAIEAAAELDAQTLRVKQGIEAVNRHLHRLAGESSSGQIIGSTVVALVAKGLRCEALWAGDSRLYRYRDGRLEQLSTDHSLMDELVRAGLMTPEEASAEGGANIITRAVGAESRLELDSLRFEAAPGDLYLLCSDGLAKELSDGEIARHLVPADLAASAQALIAAALTHGGRDNVTVVLIRPEASPA
ncbi:protein phosphatase [Methylomagnum ishizawai]|uniref:Protein phosphatase n=1 Tax=Methylomagnum ishizawai TaxID=1760988 RepID=A0A1Y6D9X5_9GAMM|nr:protein phosphatase 2C domain-containing protein [Methylomagnum ishizawai]SMF96515.1 protein phosphatase [Methylomagnum ishizawai]